MELTEEPRPRPQGRFDLPRAVLDPPRTSLATSLAICSRSRYTRKNPDSPCRSISPSSSRSRPTASTRPDDPFGYFSSSAAQQYSLNTASASVAISCSAPILVPGASSDEGLPRPLGEGWGEGSSISPIVGPSPHPSPKGRGTTLPQPSPCAGREPDMEGICFGRGPVTEKSGDSGPLPAPPNSSISGSLPPHGEGW